ncbi:solute carrier family 52, riboflavin transporter, member 3-B isoform X1 [Scophthalmus maximus]|uniref:solute carrier family 52, riboflavin transporter, member 3-B isoform X1 n=2 Tax=Scophthalmus maximus TaxID=52904 RepID=UPI001FA8D816|nr:solute carrier family 52, riboflavin transporter, member 3-B isoform X1 [Scophthalmus maximus]
MSLSSQRQLFCYRLTRRTNTARPFEHRAVVNNQRAPVYISRPTPAPPPSIMSLLTHALACLFGMGSWVAINGMWVELPLVVPEIPEGWYLPSYLTVLIQMANVGPLFVTLMHRFRPGALDERPVIYGIVALGIVATFLLAFFWRHTVAIGGSLHSVPLLVLSFLLSVVDCTSSVTFLPFMMRLRPQYLTTYFAGEGLSGLVPALVALIQGVGVVQCRNASLAAAAANTTADDSAELTAVYLPAKFPAQVFFVLLSAMMAVSLAAFVLLNHHPAVARERKSDLYFSGDLGLGKGEQGLSLRTHTPEQKPMLSPLEAVRREPRSSFGRGTYSCLEVAFIFVVLAWVNALTNAVLPSVQSYSCLPYGNKAYHLAATMAAVANPVACFIAMLMPTRSLVFMGSLTMLGSGFGAYIMAMAALSPCPLLVHSASGTVVIVLAWVLFVLTLSYVKVTIGVILRDEGHSALVWCGAVVQLGSMVGAVSMFPLVSVYGLFKSGDACNTKCPA